MVVTPVVLLSLLGGLAYAAKWGLDNFNKEIESTSVVECVTVDVGSELTADKVTLRVFNAGDKAGLARVTATFLRAKNFRVLRYANSDEKVTKPVVVGNSASDPEVQLVMGFFEDSIARGDGRPDHIVDVLLPTTLVRNDDAPESIEVDGPVCLAPFEALTASPTPSPTPTKSEKAKSSKEKDKDKEED
jgi:hypothetical protein